MIHLELARYGVKGAAFVALNLAIQVVLVEAGGLHPAVAAAISTGSMPLLGYVAMNRYVFPTADRPDRHLKRFAQYYGVNMSSKVLNYGLFLALLFVGVWYPLAYALGAAIVFLATFTVNRWLWHGAVTA